MDNKTKKSKLKKQIINLNKKILQKLNSIKLNAKFALNKLNKKQFSTLATILILSISTLSTSRAITLTISDDKAILGDTKVVEQTLKDINNYVPQVKSDLINLDQDDKKIDYAIKPEITTTESREARDNAEKEKQLAQARRNVYTRNNRSHYNINNAKSAHISSTRSSNTYSYGYCTWYAAQKRPDLPNRLGNGGSWYNRAQRNGISTGKEPRAGAVIVTGESWAGHVGYVESINGNSITISEMNYNGWNRVSTRTISKNSAIVKGYIY